MNTPQKEYIRLLLGIFFIATAGWGLFVELVETLEFGMNWVIYHFFPLIFFGFTIITGMRLLQKKDNAFKLARIIFALQVPYFFLGGIYYFFVAGASLLVSLGNVSSIHFFINSKMSLYLGGNTSHVEIGVNLLALAAFVFLRRMKNDTDEIKPEDIIQTIKPPTAGRPRQTQLPDELT
ncbi:MAG TPA: hypothetical protein VI112_05120 [Bacteroidia bacterium]|jgi:hypothetical protein